MRYRYYNFHQHADEMPTLDIIATEKCSIFAHQSPDMVGIINGDILSF